MIKELTCFYFKKTSWKNFICALSLGVHTVQTVAKYIWVRHCLYWEEESNLPCRSRAMGSSAMAKDFNTRRYYIRFQRKWLHRLVAIMIFTEVGNINCVYTRWKTIGGERGLGRGLRLIWKKLPTQISEIKN